MSDWLGLAGKTAAITGGGGGIGRAVAVGMARVGVTPILLDRDMAGCDQTLAALRLAGVEARAIACDITTRPASAPPRPRPGRWISWSTTPASCVPARSNA